jgi:hypothetical protein
MKENERRIIEGLGLGIEFELEELAELEIESSFIGKLTLLSVVALHRKVDKLMADLSALQTAVDGLVAVEGAAAEELVALKDEVAQLQVGSISQEQIDSITSKVTGVADALTQATEAAKAEPQPPAPEGGGEPPVEPPPAEGGEPAPAPEGGAEPPAGEPA